MIKKELYEKTVNILVDAYFNDTIRSYDCSACAVGNLVAANMGYSSGDNFFLDKEGDIVTAYWARVHTMAGERQYVFPKNYVGEAKKQIDSTGYSFRETAVIELSFEQGYTIENCKDPMFNGLMSVIDALDIIHENTDSNVTASTKKRFVKL